MLRVAVSLGAAIACAGVLAATGAAAPGLQVGVTDDGWLEFGPGTIQERAVRLRELGAQVARVTLDWRRIEPQQGAFDWTHADAWLEALRSEGVVPLVTLWGTPRWANGGGGPNVAPRSGATFAAFARAAAERFPWVRRWIVWNEPNQRRWLLPPSPTVYVTRLLNPAAAAIKTASPRASVGGGATAPRGGRGGTSPVDFIRGMGRAGARLDAYAHHPHALSPAETPTSGGCAQCSTITMATLDRLLREVQSAFGPRTRVWLTELGYQTNPPDRVLGVSWVRQARFVAEAQRRAYVASRVDLLVQYLVRDEPRLDAWQSGLETVAGRAKPALASFSLPLAQVGRKGSATTVWGQVRPGTGSRRYLLQRLVERRWASIGGGRTTSRGHFTRVVRAQSGTVLRLFDPATGRVGTTLVVQ
jgi:Beta-galactosidase